MVKLTMVDGGLFKVMENFLSGERRGFGVLPEGRLVIMKDCQQVVGSLVQLTIMALAFSLPFAIVII